MKNKKKEIIVFIVTVLLFVAGLFFYYQSKTIVLTTEIPYQEAGSVSYNVYLNDNTYYDNEYLPEDMQYISSIIDYIDVHFVYGANYEGIKSYNVDKSIVANVVITDPDDGDKIIYTKSELLNQENTNLNDLEVDEKVKIDYQKYNKLVNDIKSKYAISANCNLNISYNIAYSSQKDGLNAVKKLSLDIPLSKQMVNIKKGEKINKIGIYNGKAIESIMNVVMTVAMVIMFALSFGSALIFVACVRKRISGESKYDRFIAKVLKEYDSYITEAAENTKIASKEVIKVNSFKELLDVRNNIDKTIIYTKIDENTSKFQIIDEEIYEYLVTREEMDK